MQAKGEVEFLHCDDDDRHVHDRHASPHRLSQQLTRSFLQLHYFSPRVWPRSYTTTMYSSSFTFGDLEAYISRFFPSYRFEVRVSDALSILCLRCIYRARYPPRGAPVTVWQGAKDDEWS